MRPFPSVIVMVVAVTACSGPVMTAPRDTPADLEALAEATFDRFVAAFPSREACIGRVEVRGAWELDDRARYLPDETVVVVRIPATAPQLEVALIHELAHHLEFSCPAQEAVRSAFLAAQGTAGGSDWFDGPSWEETPSEQWASAVVVHVLGRADPHARIALTDEALAVVRGWAEGRLTTAAP